mgnify:FL=1
MSQRTFLSISVEALAVLASPLIAILLTGFMVGENFLEYSLHSDAAWELTYIKLLSENIFNNIYANPNMGAPLNMTPDFWPWRQAASGLFYFFIGLFKSDILSIFKTFYYLLFPLCSLSMYLSLRFYFKTTVLTALGVGVLYAFIPFITVHSVHATVVINNVGIPLLIGVVYSFYHKAYTADSFTKNLLSVGGIVAALVIFFAMSLSLYNSFYFLLILSFVVMKELISSDSNKDKLYVFYYFIVVGLLTVLFNTLPHIIFKVDNYFSYNYMTRNFGHTTVYGISIVEFFTPVLDHVLYYFRLVSAFYFENTTIKVNFLSSYLGILGAISFCAAILYSFRREYVDDFTKKMSFLGILLIFIFLVFYRGGLITALYLFTDSLILGSHYRVAPWVSCISLVASAFIIDQIRLKYNLDLSWKSFHKSPIVFSITRVLLVSVFSLIIALSLIDFRGSSSPFGVKPAYGNIRSVYLPQKEFYKDLNNIIGDNDMILKIPFRCFPETRHSNGSYYGDLWSYLLLEKKTKFGWMAFKEGTACVINSQISSMVGDVKAMVKYASYYGYTGIIINKAGFLDNGKKVIEDLKETLNLSPLVESKNKSYFGEYSYFNIKDIKDKFQSFTVLPKEGDPVYQISTTKEITLNELDKLLYFFPSPCRMKEASEMLSDLNTKGVSINKDCEPGSLQNKHFFYFSNDKINTYPEVAWSNGEMIIDNEYVGPIMSIAIHSNLSEGEYKINVISNKNIDKHVLDFNVTQWSKTFRLKKDFIFVTTEEVPAKKLKAIWVHIFKKSKTEKDVILRAVTIKKLSTN